jgi:putative membrane protein
MTRFLPGVRPTHSLLAGWLLLFWIITALNPSYRQDWLLENLLVLVAVAILLGSYRRFRFSTASYALMTLFLTLRLIGAHYTYAETPLGFWLQDWFVLQRNHYDRLVHFAFGLLLAYPVRELLLRVTGVKQLWASWLAISVVLALSALFEAMEALAAVLVSPELGAAYLGTQGDEWDAQKDSMLAMFGAMLAMIWLTIRSRWRQA